MSKTLRHGGVPWRWSVSPNRRSWPVISRPSGGRSVFWRTRNADSIMPWDWNAPAPGFSCGRRWSWVISGVFCAATGPACPDPVKMSCNSAGTSSWIANAPCFTPTVLPTRRTGPARRLCSLPSTPFAKPKPREAARHFPLHLPRSGPSASFPRPRPPIPWTTASIGLANRASAFYQWPLPCSRSGNA